MTDYDTSDPYDKGCIFFGYLTDPSYMEKINKFADRLAITHKKLGYVFNIGLYIEHLLPEQIVVNWLEIDTVG